LQRCKPFFFGGADTRRFRAVVLIAIEASLAGSFESAIVN